MCSDNFVVWRTRVLLETIRLILNVSFGCELCPEQRVSNKKATAGYALVTDCIEHQYYKVCSRQDVVHTSLMPNGAQHGAVASPQQCLDQ